MSLKRISNIAHTQLSQGARDNDYKALSEILGICNAAEASLFSHRPPCEWETVADIADYLGAPTEVQDDASLLEWLRAQPAATGGRVVEMPQLTAIRDDQSPWYQGYLAAESARDGEWLAILAAAGIEVQK